MKDILEFLSNLYWLSLPETVAGTFWHADWKGAYRRAGVIGMLAEAGQSLIGTNTWPFFVSMQSDWSGGDIEQLLNQYGIEMWGQDFHNDELFFRVRRDKAGWAQHLMLQAGVPLHHRLFAERSPGPAKANQATESGEGPTIGKVKGLTQDLEHRLDSLIDGIGSAMDL